jgi:hypothetical protein
MAVYTSPMTWAGVLITVAMMNEQIRDNWLATHGTLGYIGARVYNSANLSIPTGANTALTFNSERQDSDPAGAIHDTGSNTSRLTCKTPGVYAIWANVQFAANATGQRNAQIVLNGATAIGLALDPSATASQDSYLIVSTPYLLAANDYVEVHVFQNSGGNLNVIASGNVSPEFAMFKIG